VCSGGQPLAIKAHPGQEFHVVQLVAPGDSSAAGDAGSVLDAQAVQSYRARLLELRSELEQAQGFADVGRSEHAQREIELLTEELARAVGLGGRERRAGSAAERARTTMEKRLRDTIGASRASCRSSVDVWSKRCGPAPSAATSRRAVRAHGAPDPVERERATLGLAIIAPRRPRTMIWHVARYLHHRKVMLG
jgi:hypothetical protein